MFIKNVTNSYQSFTAGDNSFLLEPDQTVLLTDKQAEDDTVKTLLARGYIVDVEAKKATEDMVKAEEEKAKKEAENKIEITKTNSDDDKKEVAHVVQCSAVKANGDRCSSKISVKAEDFDPERPYFCGRHKEEKPEDYEKQGEVFVKKAE